MEVFFPTLQSNITALVGTLRFIVFAIMVVGLIVYAASPRTTGMSLLVPIAKAVLIVTAIAYMDQWYPTLDTSFLQVADYVDPGYFRIRRQRLNQCGHRPQPIQTVRLGLGGTSISRSIRR